MEKNEEISVNFKFVRNGTTVEKAELNEIWIDVGNKMEMGIIDHHGEGKDNSVCATEMVYKHPELVLGNITNPNEVTIVGHILPDFDCVASAYLVKQLVEKGSIDSEMQKIVDYAMKTDTGRINPSRDEVNSPYAILNSFAYMPENAGVSFDELNRNIMNNGFKLIDYCMERIRQNPELNFESHELIGDNNPFIENMNLLKEATTQYDEIVDNDEMSEKTQITLPTVDGNSQKVSGIFIKRMPKNELARDMMKNWLRDDGQVFTSIPVYDSNNFRDENGNKTDIKTARVILSVAPDKGVTLEGLGKKLEEREDNKCKELNIKRYSKDREGNVSYANRPGYDSPDPWYDGRGHNYEIVDGPMSGSVLTVEEINDTAKEYSKHIEIATRLQQSVDKSKELSQEINELQKLNEQEK